MAPELRQVGSVLAGTRLGCFFAFWMMAQRRDARLSGLLNGMPRSSELSSLIRGPRISETSR
jgi:hypothetical protein